MFFFSAIPCRLKAFTLRASGSALISFISLDRRKDIHSVKTVRSILYSELKAQVLPTLEGNNKGVLQTETHKYTHTHTQTNIHTHTQDASQLR